MILGVGGNPEVILASQGVHDKTVLL